MDPGNLPEDVKQPDAGGGSTGLPAGTGGGTSSNGPSTIQIDPSLYPTDPAGAAPATSIPASDTTLADLLRAGFGQGNLPPVAVPVPTAAKTSPLLYIAILGLAGVALWLWFKRKKKPAKEK